MEREAQGGDAARFDFPRPLLDRPHCDMSFSGLKTALRRARDKIVGEKGGLTEADRADLCAGFQAATADVLAEKTRRAMATFRKARPDLSDPVLAVAGGVAANDAIRGALAAAARREGFSFTAPPLSLCTDNAAMIAWAGLERFARGERDGMDLKARPRWPLDPAAAPMLGSGKRGAKA